MSKITLHYEFEWIVNIKSALFLFINFIQNNYSSSFDFLSLDLLLPANIYFDFLILN